MKGLPMFVALSLLVVSAAAKADPIPPEALNAEYETCVGKETSDPARLQYCACVRDELGKSWGTEAAEKFAAAHATGKDDPNEMARLEAIANNCIAKILKK